MRRKRTETKDEHLIESMKSEKRKSITKTRTFPVDKSHQIKKVFCFCSLQRNNSKGNLIKETIAEMKASGSK